MRLKNLCFSMLNKNMWYVIKIKKLFLTCICIAGPYFLWWAPQLFLSYFVLWWRQLKKYFGNVNIIIKSLKTAYSWNKYYLNVWLLFIIYLKYCRYSSIKVCPSIFAEASHAKTFINCIYNTFLTVKQTMD